MYNELTDQEELEIQNRYSYHKPKDDQPERYEAIRMKVRELAKTIMVCCPNSRERSSALTDLDSVMMRANASIARNE